MCFSQSLASMSHSRVISEFCVKIHVNSLFQGCGNRKRNNIHSKMQTHVRLQALPLGAVLIRPCCWEHSCGYGALPYVGKLSFHLCPAPCSGVWILTCMC